MSSVTVVDYGSGNLLSVTRALERCGASVAVSSDPRQIASASRVVLPGVGAFADGMAGLRSAGLVEPLVEYAASSRPLLGICLGMQLLAAVSEEFGTHEGLAVVPGRVVAVPPRATDGRALKIPHIGWSELLPAQGEEWHGSLLDTTPQHTAIYLVHSFHVVPQQRSHVLAQCEYGGNRLTAVIRSGAVMGCQFHPEKSGEAGLRILSRFLQL